MRGLLLHNLDSRPSSMSPRLPSARHVSTLLLFELNFGPPLTCKIACGVPMTKTEPRHHFTNPISVLTGPNKSWQLDLHCYGETLGQWPFHTGCPTTCDFNESPKNQIKTHRKKQLRLVVVTALQPRDIPPS